MDSTTYFNPYSNETFFGVIFQFFTRFFLFLSGNLPLNEMAADEIQVIVLIAVSASCALVGSFLVLRKMTMLANSLSHTILLGIVIAFLWKTSFSSDSATHGLSISSLLIASLIMGLITTFLTEFLTKVTKLQEDASIGLVFTSLFAVGIVCLTVLMRNAHIGTEAVMGNVDALEIDDIKLVLTIFAINAILIFLFFKEFKITTFDKQLSSALKISPVFFNYLLMAEVSATSIGAFRAVGVLMVLAFITGPPLMARLVTHDLKKLLLISVAIGTFVSIFGVALSRHLLTVYGLSLSTAGITVSTIFVMYCILAVWHLMPSFRFKQTFSQDSL